MKYKNIFLIGMMCAGKTTIGKLLSEKLNMSFFDTDCEIEKIMDKSINDIFNDYGENRFRLIESAFFNESVKVNNAVYATGGGIINNEKNKKTLKKEGISIFLDCPLKILLDRINQLPDNRPLISNNLKENIERIYNERYSIYKDCSKFIINVDNLKQNNVVDKIIEQIN